MEMHADIKDTERLRFFKLVKRLIASSDEDERHRIKEELARMTFGE